MIIIAAGPQIILEEWEKQVKANLYALDHALGCDMFEFDDWTFLKEKFLDIQARIATMRFTLPYGTAEQVREIKYGSK